MRKIIIPTLITILLLASSITSVNAFSIDQGMLNNTKLLPLVKNSDQAELPQWKVGDFWEYNLTLDLSNVVSIEVRRMEAKVTEITAEEYILSISGYLEGAIFKISNYDYSELVPAKFVGGLVYIDKETLAMKKYSLSLQGNGKDIKILPLIKVDINFDIDFSMEFDPALDFFEFPINLTENPWNIATNVNVTINGNFNLNGQDYPVEYELLNNSINDELSTTNKKVISVPAGDFESFLITGQGLEASYSSEVGYLVKLEGSIFLDPVNFVCSLDEGLISTNFTNPANNAPEVPEIDGPTSGVPGEEYGYTINTTDPNGEQVYYKIDWGDGTCSGWLGPYASGDETVVNHTWERKATYKIRAKAKDVNGYQTAWSYPMEATMPVTYLGSILSSQTIPQGSSSQNQQSTIQQMILYGLPTNN
jgi:hypothetical protein